MWLWRVWIEGFFPFSFYFFWKVEVKVKFDVG